MKRIYMNMPDYTAVGTNRAYLPYKFCKGPLAEEGIELVIDAKLKKEEDYDAYIFHRVVTPGFLPVVKDLKNRGKFIAWETDDLLDHVPDYNPNHFSADQLDRFQECLELADMILVTTPRLKKEIGYDHKTRVVPNLVDVSVWPEWTPHEDEPTLRVLFAGSPTHAADLAMVQFELLEATMRHGDRIKFFFLGQEPELKIPNSEFIPWQHGNGFIQTLATIKPHIGIAPLVSNRFNACKSGLKWLDYSMAGAWTIASDLDPYRKTTAELVYGGEWADALTGLSIGIINELVQEGRDKVVRKWSWQRQAAIWIEIFREMIYGRTT